MDNDFEPCGWGLFLVCAGASFLAGAIFGLVVAAF